ncbi:MAG: hypothetical protein KatS3mg113_0730 [Planctomycetaceae bacterium]|nr:MAG: hypothetical protein KatS3mg113_0730 [Planctomycetaceae bacterium]
MHALSRVMVVILTLASLGQAALVMTWVQGGPDWELLADSEVLKKEIAITPPQIPGQPWTATHRLTGEQVKSSKVLAEVVLAAQKRVLDDLNRQVQTLEQSIQPLKNRIEQVRQDIEQDERGLASRTLRWDQELVQLANQLEQINQQLQLNLVESSQLGREVEERRMEVLRLQQQLEMLRDDLYAADQQRQLLEEELTQLTDLQQKLQQRQQGLERQLRGKY